MKRLLFICTIVCVSCAPKIFKPEWVSEKSPEKFTARFETTKGIFDIEIERKWSPQAADRMYQLVKHHYFDDAVFYRVVPGFVVQFGGSDSVKNQAWQKNIVPDEPVLLSNKKGTLSFARSGKDSRSADVYINLADNLRLDTFDYSGVKGFPAFGMVTKGMDVVESLYDGYGEKTMDKLDTMYINRTRFLGMFPELDKINKAYILKRR
ncbi:MAG TPA: peptidylprolyl isomerase [Chitinophagaceae bacterium]|nr:peptidylprolyl isomerase [Chitinophagaceae bacterium]